MALDQKYRNVLTVQLPPNTIEWYYAFVATDGEVIDGKILVQSINLFAKITSLLSVGGLNALTTSLSPDALNLQPGNGECNVYLIADRENSMIFQRLEDRFKFYPDYSRKSLSEGVVKIKMDNFPKDKTTFFIGIENQKKTLPVNVRIEVDAVVEESYIDYSNWRNEVKDSLYQKLMQNLKKEEYDNQKVEEISGCIVEKIVTKFNPKEWEELSQMMKDKAIKQIKEVCLGEGNTATSQHKAVGLSKMAWISYSRGDVDKAIELGEASLELDKTNGDIKSKLGLFYLIKGDKNKAMEYYNEAVLDFKRTGRAKKSIQEAVKNIDDEVSKNKSLNDWQVIRDFLLAELSHFGESVSDVKDESKSKSPSFMKEKKEPEKPKFPYKQKGESK
ncbi:MAG: hypothetical protein SNJ55_08100 [Chloroherpetonaceae bacterium]